MPPLAPIITHSGALTTRISVSITASWSATPTISSRAARVNSMLERSASRKTVVIRPTPVTAPSISAPSAAVRWSSPLSTLSAMIEPMPAIATAVSAPTAAYRAAAVENARARAESSGAPAIVRTAELATLLRSTSR